MTYEIEIKPRAFKDLQALPKSTRRRIVVRIEGLADGLTGDVKRLTNHTPEYRLRVGDYRVLFELEGRMLVVYRILHRKDAYR